VPAEGSDEPLGVRAFAWWWDDLELGIAPQDGGPYAQ
jgi:hypothetical protein